MRAISLFSGIGGLDYGFGLAGIETVIQVENDAQCQLILERHWPEVARVSDVREVDASAWARRSGNVARAGRRADAEQQRPGRVADPRGDGDPGAVAAGGDMAPALAAALDGGPIDLVYGGFPCQDVSVAGKRAGLSGKRSSLWFDFERVLRDLRPRWCVIENVPGLLSSHRGRDFSLVLGGLADIGYGWAYRVLDARFFGVPQRRRRIIIVGCLGDQARAAQVLALCQSCGGHTPSGGSTGQRVAFTLTGGAADTSRRIGNAWNQTFIPEEAATLSSGAHPESAIPGRHHEDDDNLVAYSTKLANTRSNQAGKFYDEYTPALAENSPTPAVAYTLPASSRGTGDGHGNAWNSNYVEAFGGNNTSGSIDVAAARSAKGNRYDFETDTFVVGTLQAAGKAAGTATGQDADTGQLLAYPLRASDGHHGWSGGRGDGDDNLVVGQNGSDVQVGTELGTISASYARQTSGDLLAVDLYNADTSTDAASLHAVHNLVDVVNGNSTPEVAGHAFPLRADDGSGNRQFVGGVRRLTPLECERLQGFPDGWTDGPADSHRYRMLGNAVATVVAQWVGHRLAWAHKNP